MAGILMSLVLATLAARLATAQLAQPVDNKCPAMPQGNFDVAQFQLYPENADFDFANCLIYFGSLFNASVAVYDPYKSRVTDIIEFPGITHNPDQLIGVPALDPKGLLTVMATTGRAFQTGGRDLSGSNYIIKYDPVAKKELSRLNITSIGQGKFGGFRDFEHDRRGNVYVIGTFPSTIVRVNCAGTAVEPWYVPDRLVSTEMGFAGLAATGDILVVADQRAQGFFRFDMRATKGTPVKIPIARNATVGSADALYMPPKYRGKVLLVSENSGGVTVLFSRDGKWESAENRGYVNVPAKDLDGGMVVAPIQIGESLFLVVEFLGPGFPQVLAAGSRSNFPMIDVTRQVEALLA